MVVTFMINCLFTIKKNKKYKDVERVITKFLEIYIIWLKNGNYPIQTDNKYIKFKKRLDSIKKYL